MTTVTATQADILKAAQAILLFRQKSVNDPDPRHRHPMTFKDYKWDKLPITEQCYYMEMASAALSSFGVIVPEFSLAVPS